MAIEAFAPAKVNLALHVTGQRADGYHLLDSLVVFAGVGDRVSVSDADRLVLDVTGPEGTGLSAAEDNLVLRAARSFDVGRGAAITLFKDLPVASGIGGGSADAAAALRALSQLWEMPLPPPEAVLSLGADVPVCLAGRPARMSGIGGTLAEAPRLPDDLAVVLVNPRVAVSTPAVFRALGSKDNPPMEALPASFDTPTEFAGWLARLVRAGAGGATAQAFVEGESELIARFSALPGLARWVDVWEKTARLRERAESLNLDRKQVLLAVFGALQAAARP